MTVSSHTEETNDQSPASSHTLSTDVVKEEGIELDIFQDSPTDSDPSLIPLPNSRPRTPNVWEEADLNLNRLFARPRSPRSIPVWKEEDLHLSLLFDRPASPQSLPLPHNRPPTPKMAQIPLPPRGDRRAPPFSGLPTALKRYFEDVGILCDQAGTPDVDRKAAAIRYLTTEDEEVWKTVPSFKDPQKGFADFQKEVEALYPGADERTRYTLADLERVSYTYARKNISTRAELGEYWREYTRVASFLISHNIASETEVNREFIKGFSGMLEKLVRSRLSHQQPTVRPSQAYNRKDVYEAADFVLDGVDSTGISNTAVPVKGETTESPAKVKAEPTDPILLLLQQQAQQQAAQAQQQAALLQSMQEMLKAQATQLQYVQSQVYNVSKAPSGSGSPALNLSTAPSPNGQTPSTTGYSYNRERRPGCMFCGNLIHQIRECPVVEQYIQAGRCERNANRQVVLPGQSWIPGWIKGDTLQERMDTWWKESGKPIPPLPPLRDAPPHQSVHIWELAEDQEVEIKVETALELEDMTPDEILEMAKAGLALQQIWAQEEEKGKKKVRFDAVEMPPRPAYKKPSAPKASTSGSTSKPSTPATPKSPSPAESSKSTGTTSSKDGLVYPPTRPKANEKPLPRTPQTRLQTPIESDTVAEEVLKRFLNISTSMTLGEVLACSEPMRNRLKERTTPKRVPVSGNFLGTEEEEQEILNISAENESRWSEKELGGLNRTVDGLLSASDAESLRCIYAELGNDGRKFEVLLDDGSSIVVVREDVWESLGVPMNARKQVRLETAGGQINTTLGLIENLQLWVGEVPIYVQAHVARNCPFEVLLGRPFDRFTALVKNNKVDGAQTITVTDPNSGEVSTVASYPRLPVSQRRRTVNEPLPRLGF